MMVEDQYQAFHSVTDPKITNHIQCFLCICCMLKQYDTVASVEELISGFGSVLDCQHAVY